MNSPTLQPLTAMAEQNEDTNMLAASSEAQDGDVEACGIQNTCQPVENPAQDGRQNQPSSEDSNANQVTQTLTQYIDSLPDHSDQAFLEPQTCSSLTQPAYVPTSDFGLRVSDTWATSVTSIMPHLYSNPLQLELERLKKQQDQTLKSHEDKKLHLKYEYLKRVKKAVAELRQQYENEKELLHKNEKLEEKTGALCNRILMDTTLSQVLDTPLRSNSMDATASSSPVMQLDGNPFVTKQPVSSCMQNNGRMPYVVSQSSLTSPPAACPRTTPLSLATSTPYRAPPMQAVQLLPTSASLENQAVGVHIGSFSSFTERPQGAVKFRTPPPHLQSRRHLTPFTDTNPFSHEGRSHSTINLAGPMHIGSFSSSTKRPLGGLEIRTSPPHLRPSTSFIGTSPLSHEGRSLCPANSAGPIHIDSSSSSTGRPVGGVEIRRLSPQVQFHKSSTPFTGASPLSREGGSSYQQSHRFSPAYSLSSLSHAPQPLAPRQIYGSCYRVHHNGSARGPSISVSVTRPLSQSDIISNQQPHRSSSPLLSPLTHRPSVCTEQVASSSMVRRLESTRELQALQSEASLDLFIEINH